MKPDEVQLNMVECSKLTIQGAQVIIDTFSDENIKKLTAAYEKCESEKGLKDRVIVTYRMLNYPGDVIMDGEDVRDGVASLCMALVLLGRSIGITFTLGGGHVDNNSD